MKECVLEAPSNEPESTPRPGQSDKSKSHKDAQGVQGTIKIGEQSGRVHGARNETVQAPTITSGQSAQSEVRKGVQGAELGEPDTTNHKCR